MKWIPLFLACSCAATSIDTVSLHPNVYIDRAFTFEEANSIRRGLTLWEQAIPEIKFAAKMWDGEAETELNSIYVMHLSCKPFVGFTNRWPYHAHICMDWQYVEEHPTLSRDDWAALTAHEVGHALGMEHVPSGPAIMAPGYGDWSGKIEQVDINQMVEFWHLPR